MLELVQAAQVGGDYGSDGARIGGSVGMATDVLVHRAGIETGSASNAIQGLALLFFGEQFRAPVVDQNHVHGFRAVRFTGLAVTGQNAVVHRDPLAGAKRGQQGPKVPQIFHAG